MTCPEQQWRVIQKSTISVYKVLHCNRTESQTCLLGRELGAVRCAVELLRKQKVEDIEWESTAALKPSAVVSCACAEAVLYDSTLLVSIQQNATLLASNKQLSKQLSGFFRHECIPSSTELVAPLIRWRHNVLRTSLLTAWCEEESD